MHVKRALDPRRIALFGLIVLMVLLSPLVVRGDVEGRFDACQRSAYGVAGADLEIYRGPAVQRDLWGVRRISTGQEISVKGLLCLCDASGPCANAVKDAQRTKTDAGTTSTVSVLWGPSACSVEVEQALAWYLELLSELGGKTERIGSVAEDD